jgi:hypothetical protein
VQPIEEARPKGPFLPCSCAAGRYARPMIEHAQLTHADHADLVQSLAHALRYNRSGKRVADRDIMTSQAAAEHLIAQHEGTAAGNVQIRTRFRRLDRPDTKGSLDGWPTEAWRNNEGRRFSTSINLDRGCDRAAATCPSRSSQAHALACCAAGAKGAEAGRSRSSQQICPDCLALGGVGWDLHPAGDRHARLTEIGTDEQGSSADCPRTCRTQ